MQKEHWSLKIMPKPSYCWIMRYWYNWTLFFSSVQSYLLHYVHDADIIELCSILSVVLITITFSAFSFLACPFWTREDMPFVISIFELNWRGRLAFSVLERQESREMTSWPILPMYHLLCQWLILSPEPLHIDRYFFDQAFECQLHFLTCLSYGRQKCLSQTHTNWLWRHHSGGSLVSR